VQSELENPPSYSAVRKLLEILERRGHVRHTVEGRRYIYAPAETIGKARMSALRQMLNTFFGGSAEQAVVALLGLSGRIPDEDRLREILAMAGKADQRKRT
jgi:predicted transcriptional regulator